MAIVIEKAAIKSKAILGALLGFIPITLDVLNSAQDILQALPPTVDTSSIASAIGAALVILSKISDVQSKITGIFQSKKESEKQSSL